MIAQFLSPTMILAEADGAEGTLVEPLKFYSAELRGILIVPPGFTTDFASIPRGLWNLLPKRGKHDRPAVLHDGAYRDALVTVGGQRVHLTKPLADRLFLEAMQAAGVGVFSRTLMYNAVRFFGGDAYEADQRAARAARDAPQGDPT